jgi:plastocyanin
LAAHPLAPGNPDDPRAGSPQNPIEQTSSGNSVEFTFTTPGTYAYYCELHTFGAGSGMAGAVFVR